MGAMGHGDREGAAGALRAELDGWEGEASGLAARLEALDGAIARADLAGVDPALLAEALLQRGEARTRRGDVDGADGDLERAMLLADASGRRDLIARAAMALGENHYLRDRVQEAGRCWDRAAHLFGELSDRGSEVACLCRAALAAFQDGRADQASEWAEVAVRRARLWDEPRALRQALSTRGWLDRQLGRLVDAAQTCREVLELHRSAGAVQGVARAMGELAAIARERGDLADAEEAGREALRSLDALGDRRASCETVIEVARCALLAGRTADARDAYERAAVHAREIGDAHSRALVLAELAYVAHAEGRPELGALVEAADASFPRNAVPAQRSVYAIYQQLLSLLAKGLDPADASDTAEVTPALPSADGRFALELLRRLRQEPAALRIAEDGRWFELPQGRRVELGRRGPARRILAALARARCEGGDRALPRDRVFEAGWPGERCRPAAATARVHTAIRTLRELGLRPHLALRDDGYLLVAEVEIVAGPG